MENRWHHFPEASPTVDKFKARVELWLYNSDGVDVVFRGYYLDHTQATKSYWPARFYDLEGNDLVPSHWVQAREGEREPPMPPDI